MPVEKTTGAGVTTSIELENIEARLEEVSTGDAIRDAVCVVKLVEFDS